MNKLHLSTNLRTLRKENDLTQFQFADQLKIPREVVTQYEVGNARPPYETLIAISDYFKVSIDDLLRVDITTLTAEERSAKKKPKEKRKAKIVLLEEENERLLELMKGNERKYETLEKLVNKVVKKID